MSKQLRNFWCPNRIKCTSCEVCSKKGDIQIDAEEHEIFECINNDDVNLKLMGTVVHGKLGAKMTPIQIQSERKVRSHKDFKKNIFPKFKEGSDEHIHFSNKLKAK